MSRGDVGRSHRAKSNGSISEISRSGGTAHLRPARLEQGGELIVRVLARHRGEEKGGARQYGEEADGAHGGTRAAVWETEKTADGRNTTNNNESSSIFGRCFSSDRRSRARAEPRDGQEPRGAAEAGGAATKDKQVRGVDVGACIPDVVPDGAFASSRRVGEWSPPEAVGASRESNS